MGYHNPPIPWSELESKLSDRRRPDARQHNWAERHVLGDGGDSPAWSRKRGKYAPKDRPRRPSTPTTPYAELHCHSHYSFLDGASSPEELVEESVQLGLHALAVTDHDGFYGIVRMAEAAEAYDLSTVFGAELSLGLTKPQNGIADPEGGHLLVLAGGEEGYHRLAKVITTAQLAGGEKGKPAYDLASVADGLRGHAVVLTGCRKGAVRQALQRDGIDLAERELRMLVDLFGADSVDVELFDHGHPLDTVGNEQLAELARRTGLRMVATNNVHYAAPDRHRLAAAVSAVRARRSLDDMDGWLPASPHAH